MGGLMDREIRQAVRHVRATGQILDFIEQLIDGCSWDTLTDLEQLTQRRKRIYKARRILRAFELPRSKLLEFKLQARDSQKYETKIPIRIATTSYEGLEIIFRNEQTAIGADARIDAIELIDDEGFSFGYQYLKTPTRLTPLDFINVTYTLRAES
jgi:hypothetical protein